ncbi:acyl-CoA thioesterase [Paraglaciecola aestuariivivens]
MQQNLQSDPSQPAFTFVMRVRYGECDAQQVVFNARYADYIDVAMTEYFRVAVGGFGHLLEQGLDNQVVSLHIDWKSSAIFDDVISLQVTHCRVGTTSYTFEINIAHLETKRTIANASITYVLINTADYQKTAVPNWLREKLLTKPKVSIVDQSGSHNLSATLT